MTNYEKSKLGILSLFTIGFLICFYNYSQNGRYIVKNDEFTFVIDSRTGDIYSLGGRKKFEINTFKIKPEPHK